MLSRVLARQRQLHHELLLALAPDSCCRSLLKSGREAQPAGWTNEHGRKLAVAHRRPDEKTSVWVSRTGSRLHETLSGRPRTWTAAEGPTRFFLVAAERAKWVDKPCPLITM